MFQPIFVYICMMKHLWRIFFPLVAAGALLGGAAVSCSRPEPVDESYPWPASGVEEADSLLLAFERLREGDEPGAAEARKAIATRLCSIAEARKGNPYLDMRRLYMATCTLLAANPREAYARLLDGMSRLDSLASPFDYHALMALRLPGERSIYAKYVIAADNAEFFDKAGAEVELARNLVLKGNVLTELSDTSGALAAFGRAEALFGKHGLAGGICAVRLNSLPLYGPERARDVLAGLLADPLVMSSPKLSVPVLQTAYCLTDSVELLDRAIAIASEVEAQRQVLPILLAMKASDLVLDGDARAALDMTGPILEAEAEYGSATRYRPVIHNNLAMVYEANGMADSCIRELVEAASWTDSLHRESSYRRVYANEARMLIDAAGLNARLERRNLLMWWIVSLLLVAGTGMAAYFHIRRKARERRSQIRLLDEKIEHERRLNFAQASVLEQSDRIIAELKAALDSMSRESVATSEARKGLSALLASYRSNEEGRRGLLQVSREVSTGFSQRLKQDYPTLSESQLRLAALIAAGVDSAQISAILNISAKSLYTSRYRLRARLGLPKEAILEDFLRTYAGTTPPPGAEA